MIAPISNLILNLLFSALKCRLDIGCNKQEFNKRKNFFNFLFSESRKDVFDIDLVMFWSFIGLKLLETCKFRKTSFLFLVLNIIMLCLVYVFDFIISDENYSFIRIFLLALLYLFISLTLGSSSLISQQVVIDIYSNLKLCSCLYEERNGYDSSSYYENIEIIKEKNSFTEININNNEGIIIENNKNNIYNSFNPNINIKKMIDNDKIDENTKELKYINNKTIKKNNSLLEKSAKKKEKQLIFHFCLFI